MTERLYLMTGDENQCCSDDPTPAFVQCPVLLHTVWYGISHNGTPFTPGTNGGRGEMGSERPERDWDRQL